MTIYERVLSAVKPFDLPVSPQAYTGTASSYMVVDVQATDTLDGDDEPVFAFYQATLSLYSPIRADTVGLCTALQQAVYAAGFSFPTLTPGGVSLDGSRKCQVLSFGRWDDWQSSTLMMS